MVRLRRTVSVLAAVTLLAGAFVHRAEAALPVEHLGCGSVVDHSLKLANNLQCMGDGLRVVASGIVLDLGGHRVSGDGGAIDAGVVSFAADLENYIVRNGTVAGFGVGVRIDDSSDVKLENLQVTHNGESIHVTGSSDVAIIGNTVSGNANGIQVDGGISVLGGLTIKSNRSEGNDGDGIIVSASTAPVIKNNTVRGNLQDGIDLGTTQGAAVTGNTVSDNGADGAIVTNSPGVKLKENRIARNRFSGIVLDNSPGVVVSGNRLIANSTDGLFVQPTSLAPTIKRNVAKENGLHGMDVQRADATISRNKANRNGFLNETTPEGDDNGIGIVAPDTVSGSGNRARANDDPRECLPGYLC